MFYFIAYLKSIALANNCFHGHFDTDLEKKLKNVFYFHPRAPQM